MLTAGGEAFHAARAEPYHVGSIPRSVMVLIHPAKAWHQEYQLREVGKP